MFFSLGRQCYRSTLYFILHFPFSIRNAFSFLSWCFVVFRDLPVFSFLNHSLSLKFPPNFRLSWQRIINVFHHARQWIALVNELFGRYLNCCCSFCSNVSFKVNTCQTAWGRQAIYLNCWQIYIFRFLLIFVLGIQSTISFHNCFLYFGENYSINLDNPIKFVKYSKKRCSLFTVIWLITAKKTSRH